ncbi:unnamed protein product [Vitrella brassicaformis CCMP3155]|uniref:Secreted protein n=1 Tax=Vitrella brassicaformis (strain CCMP3155) TaxID=1169540 RepID=A0A0G4E9E6_VITBC|nr:unnamed protein product [Vitrella brassicaformis CCMP3155]|eukprot:CEL92216.1 unnamed protein product [Vitrella brassicaformis CCMP3155]
MLIGSTTVWARWSCRWMGSASAMCTATSVSATRRVADWRWWTLSTTSIRELSLAAWCPYWRPSQASES